MYARIVPGIFGFPASLAIVIAFGVLLFPGLTLIATTKALRHLGIRRRLQRAAEKPFSGRPGPAVLRGRVVSSDDLAPVEVSIEQVGTELLTLQTRMQASMQTTSMLFQLSLVNYLK